MTTEQQSATRWIGDFPKIGIRPSIDGRRRGVRESLEESEQVEVPNELYDKIFAATVWARRA